MRVNLSVTIGTLRLKNPVLVASGTFGYAEEFVPLFNLKTLGAVVTKTITVRPRAGNTPPRTCETPAGLLNSIGLENPGIELFIQERLPILKKIGVPIIMSIAAEEGVAEFKELAKRIDFLREAAAIEVNISCPNVRHPGGPSGGSGLIAQDPNATYDVLSAIRKVTKKTLLAKLSPNVTDITKIAHAAEEAGCDGISLMNTLAGLSVDAESRSPRLGNVTGGLSGPAVKPVALQLIWQAYQKVHIPIIGMGGIMNASDALEFFIVGATAISVGTGLFINPRASLEILQGIKEYCVRHRIEKLKDLTGSMKR